MTILYDYEDSLYVNLTNKCPCACVFCIRKETDHVGNSDSLWLDHEPTVEEVKKEFKNFDLNKEYQNNLKTVLQLKLDEYGYELEDIDFDGTDIESLKIKEKDNQNNLNLSNQKNNSESKENNTDKNNNTNQNKSSEVFRNSTTNKTQNENNLKNDLIKILEVSIDKIEID